MSSILSQCSTIHHNSLLTNIHSSLTIIHCHITKFYSDLLVFNCPIPSNNGPLYFHNDPVSPHKDLLFNHICLLSHRNNIFIYHKYFSNQNVPLSDPLSTCLLPLHNDSLTRVVHYPMSVIHCFLTIIPCLVK